MVALLVIAQLPRGSIAEEPKAPAVAGPTAARDPAIGVKDRACRSRDRHKENLTSEAAASGQNR